MYGGKIQEIGGGVVLYEKLADGICVITLNKPGRMNGWADDLASAWYDAYDMATADPEVRVIIVTGAGRAWCAGADLSGLQNLSKNDGASAGPSKKRKEELKAGIVNDGKGRPLNYALYVPKPIIAAINGACAGGGFSQAMSCDVRFAADGAKFTTAFPRRGLIAEWGVSWTLPRIAGVGNAMDMLLSGRTFRAAEAQKLGIVQQVFAPDELMSKTIEYATDMAINVPPNSLAIIKQQVLRHQHANPENSLRESNQLMLLSVTKANPDFTEGVNSFIEKRKPQFAPLDFDSPMQQLKEQMFQQKLENEALKNALEEAKKALRSRL